MGKLTWAEPALQDLDAIADFIALDKPEAAKKFMQRFFPRVELLAKFPRLGSIPREIPDLPHRQLVILPCRIFYRIGRKAIYIIHVMRGEQLLSRELLEDRDQEFFKG